MTRTGAGGATARWVSQLGQNLARATMAAPQLTQNRWYSCHASTRARPRLSLRQLVRGDVRRSGLGELPVGVGVGVLLELARTTVGFTAYGVRRPRRDPGRVGRERDAVEVPVVHGTARARGEHGGP